MKKIILSILLALLLPQIMLSQTVGLVMSGGGARGIAHIGVIQALEENNIPIDYVAGTSMGAIVAALYAMGYSPQDMKDILASEDFHNWQTGNMDKNYMFYFRRNKEVPELLSLNFDLKDSIRIYKPSINLINPNPMSLGFLETYSQYTALCNNNFDSLFVPFRAVASDIYNKKQVIFDKGDLGDAVRASMTFPLVFKPIKKDSVLLYDGGIFNNFPADVMKRDFNPDFMIGSVVSKNAGKPDDTNLMNQVLNLAMDKSNYTLPDSNGVLLTMDLSRIALLDFHKLDEVCEVGYNAMNEMIDSVKRSVSRRVDSTYLANRRAEFKKRLPPLRFKNIEINGATAEQQRFIKKEFHDEGEIFDYPECKKAFYRLLSGNSIIAIVPHATYNRTDSTYTLHLDVEMAPPFTLKMGGALSTNNSNQIYYGLHYRNFKKRSKEFILDGQLGKIYNNVQLSGRFDFATEVPFSLKLIGSLSTIDYYNMEYMFTKENAVALNHQREMFVKMKMTLPFLMRKKAEFGVGVAYMKDEYINSNIIDLNLPQFDRNRNYLFGGSLKFEGNTLDHQAFPTSGSCESLRAQFFLGKEKFHSPQRGVLSKEQQSWLQMSYTRKEYFQLNNHFVLGAMVDIFYSTRGLSSTYQTTMMQAGAFTPTMNSLFNYNTKYRANQYVAGGISPIYKINNFIQLKWGMYGFVPYREIREKSDGTAYFSEKRFNNFQYITELALACKFSKLELSTFIDYYSSNRSAVNIGLTLGWFLLNERFIE
ncbi:MAG: patatin-like phospholipase family protein [Bacteroidaceae bacterium]|nr:patatin-like phospholipase family protein [Bacteroidaceae bacterium]